MTRQTYSYQRRSHLHSEGHSSSLTSNSLARSYRERRSQSVMHSPPNTSPSVSKSLSGYWFWLVGLATITSVVGIVTLGEGGQFQAWRSSPSPSGVKVTPRSPPATPPIARIIPKSPPVTPPTRSVLTSEEVYQRASPAVITILTPKGSMGSGVFINRSGIALTNEHVVEQFSTVQVKLASGQVVDGEVISVDPERALVPLNEINCPKRLLCKGYNDFEGKSLKALF